MRQYHNPLYDDHHDLPIYANIPKISYVLSSSPRCGSTYLAALISQTKTLGAPHEYLAEDNFRMMQVRFQTPDDHSTMREIVRRRTSELGVFGVKLHANQLAQLRYMQSLGHNFEISKYVFIQRKDRIRQAISYAKAVLSQEWIAIENYSHPESGTINSNKIDVEGMLGNIDRENNDWLAFFSDKGIDPLIVFYEDVLENPQCEVDRIAQWLGVPSGQVDQSKVPLKRQSNEETEEIIRSFRAKVGSSN
ncbi:Stf0 family sulfotransferase [Methylobacterium sp. 092160098-2]|uniref:Stf0 family sulfotransferase n=1 Tax=Methylobacterium sp. 092160098-2 TaxID=3025129 RepID=UPI002381D04B|nr:Stf0 family sulfotransferase [Methylobacterium sp. 092160098-2]MDE4912805.1 Stf0 family sulfotransferase [Methylobacterium sp. 092160098-2]